MSELDEFFFFNDIREYIEKHGADRFVQQLASLFPKHAYAITSSVLHEHAQDYDKKKAVLLRARKGE